MNAQCRDLDGKIAIVSGVAAKEGIGFATARTLALAGARVVAVNVTADGLAASVDELSAQGLDVVARVADISSEESVVDLYAFVRNMYGRVDILDNNAASQGQHRDGLVADLSVTLWDEIMAVNARGTMLMCKHALPLMVAGGGGSIINISSGTALAGDFFATAYAASKGAVNTLTRYVATQYAPQGIRCNALSVGLVLTGALKAGMPEPMMEVFRQHLLTPALGRPQDIAEVVLFLASDRSRYITGQLIPVDGGFYAHVPTTVDVARMMAAG